MGKYLECLADAGIQIIVETHSEHIIDGARIQAALMKQTDDIQIYFFSKKKVGAMMRLRMERKCWWEELAGIHICCNMI